MKKVKKKKKLGCLLFIEIFIIIGIILGALFYFTLSKLNNNSDVNKDNIIINEDIDDRFMDGYRNFILFGLDSQDNSLSSGNRSDSIIIASLNNKTKEVKLLSVYRDTYVSVEGHDFTKITHAYAYGGAELAINTINRNFDLDITEYVTVNFRAVADVIDLLGGIEINIEEDEIKDLNKYIKNMNKINGGSSTSINTTGKHILDGNQAVAYSRIRKTSGGDQRRTQRQREILDALLKKAKKSDIVTIMNIIKEIIPEISTNISTSDLLLLAKDLFSYEILDSDSFPFENEDIKLNGIYYGIPLGFQKNVIEMHTYLFGSEEYIPSSTVSYIDGEISTRTGLY